MAKGAYSPFFLARAYVLSSVGDTEKRTFCLFQFSIKLICNAKHSTALMKKTAYYFLPGKYLNEYTNTWVLKSGTKHGIPSQRCKICFTLKVGSHNSHNAISIQPKMKKQTSTLCLYTSAWVFVFVFVFECMLNVVDGLFFVTGDANAVDFNPLLQSRPTQNDFEKIINISKLPKTLIVSVLFPFGWIFLLVCKRLSNVFRNQSKEKRKRQKQACHPGVCALKSCAKTAIGLPKQMWNTKIKNTVYTYLSADSDAV